MAYESNDYDVINLHSEVPK